MKLKTLFSLFLTALLLILPVLPVSAAGDPAITVDMPDTVEPGKQFVLSVNIENNPGWSALQFEITYDTAQMKLLDLDRGEAMDDYYRIWFSYNENPLGRMTAIGLYNDSAPTVEESGNMEKNGSLMKLYFQVADDVVAGTDVSVKVDMPIMSNAKLEPQMDPTVVKATAKVGTMAVEDNKTEPSRSQQAVVSGMIGTNAALSTTAVEQETGIGNATGQATNADGQVTNVSGQVTNVDSQATNAEGQVTNASGQVVDSNGNVVEDTFPWNTVLIVGGVVVLAGVAIILLVVLNKKSRK